MKIRFHFDNGLWKVSPNIQYLFGNCLSIVPIKKKCISFYLFYFKLYTRISISKRLKKHRQDIEKLSKTIENQMFKHRRIEVDISFIK